jgi:hypothetical protein
VKSSFTVDITGTTGMRTGEWADGEEFLILPDDRSGQEDAAARVRLLDAGHPPPEGGGPAPPPEHKAAPPGAADAPGGQVTVAEIEERTERRRGMPHPVLVVQGTDDKALCTVLPEQPGVPEPRSFRVEDDQGELLCRIIRAPSRIGRRAYWRILPADGSPPVTGHRGTWMGWVGFVLTFPVWLVFFLGSLLVTVFTLGEVSEMLVWGAPKRVTWRRRWALPLVGNALDFRYVRSGYRWDPALLDARIAYAQAALHYFTKMHKD